MKVTVVGLGYVGLPLSLILSKYNHVTSLDVDEEKVRKVQQKISPLNNADLQDFINNNNLNINATTNAENAYRDAEIIIISTPTNFDIKTNRFDTSSVESAILESMQFNRKASIFIKSTIPLGFTDYIRKKTSYEEIYFSPEFLREDRCLYDSLHPSRIIVGGFSKNAKQFSNLLARSSLDNSSDLTIIHMTSNEAEAVKLFANTYLAMRVSFFNELDSFCEFKNLSVRDVIDGVCADDRIGNYYNNPSFGYGGYCLPKDTRQLLDSFSEIPNNIIKAVVNSNETRKDFITKSILNKNPKIVGIYRLIMKQNSDNFRESAIIDIILRLKKMKINLIIFEPYLDQKNYLDVEVTKDLEYFTSKSDLIIANRVTSEIEKYIEKVYSRDVFTKN